MNFQKWTWLILKLLVVLLVPTVLYLWLCQSVLNHYLKPTITNEPDSGLARSLSTLKISLEQEDQILFSQASHAADNARLQHDLISKITQAKWKKMGQELDTSFQRPLFILADLKGNVLYDTLNLPASAPVSAPQAAPTGKKGPAASQPELTPFSLKDWPGFNSSLAGGSPAGLITYKDQYYLAVSSPVLYKKKVAGAVMLGVRLNGDVLQKFRSITQNDMAFYTDGRIQFSTFPPRSRSDVDRTSFTAKHKIVTISGQDFLWDDFSLRSLDQFSAGHFFVFQPLRQSITVQGSPQKVIFRLGLALIFLMFALGLWYTLNLLSPLRHMTEQINEIQKGNWNISLPVQRMDAWGSLANSLSDMIQDFKDKERVSLVLGKVVSPQSVKKILDARDYFALKGERRECTLLQAQLKGFNTLSQNMAPEVLVEALNQYLSFINEIVFKHEGMLDRFIGETAIAVWGAPFTSEDKELRAAKAALEIQESLKKFNIARIKKGQTAFTLGIGIHTGLVVSGNLGSEKYHDYSIIGEPLQTVAYLCSLASPGQIIVSEETYERISGLIKAKPLNTVAVKGLDKPVKTYEITKLS